MVTRRLETPDFVEKSFMSSYEMSTHFKVERSGYNLSSVCICRQCYSDQTQHVTNLDDQQLQSQPMTTFDKMAEIFSKLQVGTCMIVFTVDP